VARTARLLKGRTSPEKDYGERPKRRKAAGVVDGSGVSVGQTVVVGKKKGAGEARRRKK